MSLDSASAAVPRSIDIKHKAKIEKETRHLPERNDLSFSQLAIQVRYKCRRRVPLFLISITDRAVQLPPTERWRFLTCVTLGETPDSAFFLLLLFPVIISQ